MLIGSKPLSEMSEAEMLAAIEELRTSREALAAEAKEKREKKEKAAVKEPKEPKGLHKEKDVANILEGLFGKK